MFTSALSLFSVETCNCFDGRIRNARLPPMMSKKRKYDAAGFDAIAQAAPEKLRKALDEHYDEHATLECRSSACRCAFVILVWFYVMLCKVSRRRVARWDVRQGVRMFNKYKDLFRVGPDERRRRRAPSVVRALPQCRVQRPTGAESIRSSDYNGAAEECSAKSFANIGGIAGGLRWSRVFPGMHASASVMCVRCCRGLAACTSPSSIHSGTASDAVCDKARGPKK